MGREDTGPKRTRTAAHVMGRGRCVQGCSSGSHGESAGVQEHCVVGAGASPTRSQVEGAVLAQPGQKQSQARHQESSRPGHPHSDHTQGEVPPETQKERSSSLESAEDRAKGAEPGRLS